MAWSLPEMECLTLYYDSVEELGQLACLQWFYFASSGGQSRIECVGRGKPKSDHSLKKLRIDLRSEMIIEKTTRH